MRLTLRTLLAYLDDTLDPAQTKLIGAKVAESEEAQKLIERIKTVTRRRRLTALPVDGPDSTTDPNTIAEYLDSTLSSEQLVEVEETGLTNDTMLAELAACHQILTLVLGEPARVPTTARARMYKLVKGPESQPYRTPTADTPVVAVTPPEAPEKAPDEDILDSLLGPQKIYWFLGSLLLGVLLITAIWLALPPTQPTPKQGYVLLPSSAAPAPKVPSLPKVPDVPDTKTPIAKEYQPEQGPEPRVVVPVVLPMVPKKPDEQRDTIATLDVESFTLLARKRETAKWDRVLPQTRIHSTDTILALPGFQATFTTDTGLKIQLWGNTSELLNVPVTAASITPYIPPRGIDAEFTLHAGRVFITAPKATLPVVVRVRFLDEVWDITLNNNTTEIALDRIGEPARVEAFAPVESARCLLYLGVLQGTASFRDGPHQSGMLSAGTKIKYDNKAGRPVAAPKNDPDEAALVDRWAKAAPNTRDATQMQDAIKALHEIVKLSAQIDLEFEAIAKNKDERRLSLRTLAVMMLAAVDSLSYLIDAIEYDNAAVREAATQAAIQYASQDSEHLDEFIRALGMKATYTEDQRATIATLVQGAGKPTGDNVDKVFALLKSDKLAVREFAKAYLVLFDPNGPKDYNLDTAQAAELRNPKVNNWLQAWKRREMKAKDDKQ